MTYKRFGWQ